MIKKEELKSSNSPINIYYLEMMRDNYVCYDINENYKIIYNQRINSKFIIDILTIDDD